MANHYLDVRTLLPPLQVSFLFRALSPLVEAVSAGDVECLSDPHGQAHNKKYLHGYPNQQDEHGEQSSIPTKLLLSG